MYIHTYTHIYIYISRVKIILDPDDLKITPHLSWEVMTATRRRFRFAKRSSTDGFGEMVRGDGAMMPSQKGDGAMTTRRGSVHCVHHFPDQTSCRFLSGYSVATILKIDQ